MPAPTISKERPHAEPNTEGEVWALNAPPWIESGPKSNWITIGQLRIVIGHIYHIRILRLYADRAPLARHALLRRCVQVPCALRFGAHELYGGHDIRLLVVIRVAQLRGPGKILVHVGKHGWELSQTLHARVPVLLVHFHTQRRTSQIWILLEKSLRLDNLRWISRSCKNLRNQCIRVERDRRNQLLQLFRRQWSGRRLTGGLRRRSRLLNCMQPDRRKCKNYSEHNSADQSLPGPLHQDFHCMPHENESQRPQG